MHVCTHTETHISTEVSNLPGFECHLEQGPQPLGHGPGARPYGRRERQVGKRGIICVCSLSPARVTTRALSPVVLGGSRLYPRGSADPTVNARVRCLGSL